MMRNWRITALFPFLWILIFLSACSSSFRLFEAANEPINAEARTSYGSPGGPVSDSDYSGSPIRFNGYEWGEDFIRLLSEKTENGNLSGSDYVYNENIGSFSRELVFSEQFADHLFRCYYDFDQDDRLVSVMLSLHEKLSPVDTVILQRILIDKFISDYGPWDTAEDLFDPDIDESIQSYADAIAAGRKQSTAIWNDASGTQLLTKCQRNSATGQIDLILLFSTGEYT